MKKPREGYLSKREQQIMDLLHAHDALSASDVVALLPDAPSNSTVRTLLKILEDKAQVTHQEVEGKYIYRATQTQQSVAKAALGDVVRTFFRGNVCNVVTTLIEEKPNLSSEEIDEIQRLIDAAKEQGK